MIEIKRESLLIGMVAALVLGFVIGRVATKSELTGLQGEAKKVALRQLQSPGPTPRSNGPVAVSPPAPAVTQSPAAAPVAAPPTPPPVVAQAAPTALAEASAKPAPPAMPAPVATTSPVARLEKIWRVRKHDDDATKGAAQAPVSLVVFSAFGCQPCMQFAPHLDKLMADPAYAGKVRVHFKHKIFDAPSPDAFVAARAAAAAQRQGKFWQMRAALHEARFSVGRDAMDAIATKVGLNLATFNKDIDSDAVRAQVLRDSLGAYEVGAHSFPNILANGVRIKKPKDFNALKSLVDGQIARAKTLAAQGHSGAALYAKAVEGGKTFPQLAPKVAKFDTSNAPTKGNPKGSIQMVAFEDFECPFCSKSAPNLQQFMNAFPKDVALVFKHFPLAIHANAPLAHQASQAAHAQGKFWQYHDKLFANQTALTSDDLKRYAKEVGLKMSTFNAALDAGEYKPDVNGDLTDGRRAQVSATPTIFLNGRKYQGPRGYHPLGLEAVAREFLGLTR